MFIWFHKSTQRVNHYEAFNYSLLKNIQKSLQPMHGSYADPHTLALFLRAALQSEIAFLIVLVPHR